MTPIGRRKLLASLPVASLVGTSAAAEQMKVTLGLGEATGGFAAYAATLVDAIRAVDPTFEIKAVPTKGIPENVAMLESGDLDIGLVFGEVAYELFKGIGRSPTRLKVISVMYSTPVMFVVRADSRYRRIGDLKDHPIVWNGRNSNLAVQARYVMDGLGLNIDEDFQAIYTDQLSEGPQMVIDGQAAALWGIGNRWPGFVEVANNARGARFVVPSADQIAHIHAKHGFLTGLTVPAGLYRGQYDAIYTIGGWNFILARADLDDPVGYRLASSLYKIDRAGALSRQLTETTAKNTLAAIPGPEFLQPGVARFYMKMDLLK